MQDIAKALNISRNSVSRALSGKPGVSEETRKLVIETAKKLGYDYKERKPATEQKVQSIGLVASDYTLSQPIFFGEIFLSLQNEVRKREMNLLIESVSPEAAKKMVLPSFVRERSVQGIIMLSHITTEYINKIIASGIPTILIDHHHPHIEADSILTNNRFGAYLAVEYLIEHHHKKIGFVGDIYRSPSYEERLLGYLKVHEDYKLPVHDKFILKDTPDDEERIKQFIESLDEMPTAWFCANDRLGYIVNQVLQAKGFRIPEDMSIVSFDNGQFSQLASPKITSMDIKLDYYAEKGIDLLLWRINNPKAPIQEVVISPTLALGNSVSRNKES